MPAPGSTSPAYRRVRDAALAVTVLVCLAPAPAAAEDRLTAMGDTLRGRVVEMDADGVEFEPVYGKGTIRVPWEEVEEIETGDTFIVLYGERGEVFGRVLGIDEQGHVVVGEEFATADRIATYAVFLAFADSDGELEGIERLRSQLRYWSASLDAGALYVKSNTNQTSAVVGFRTERRKHPTRLLLEGSFRYATEKERRQDRRTTENIVYGLARGELDWTDRTYGYVSTRASYDENQHLSLRLEPRAGVGVRIVESKRFNLSGDIGGGWVYENYYGRVPIEGLEPLRRRRGRDDSWTVAFGAQADAKLPYGVIWRARAEYLPAVDDWGRDYLVRGQTELEFPLLEWLAFKVALSDEYDHTPADDSVRNRFTGTAALSLRF